MATFTGLFDFIDDLSEGQSELSSPPDSSVGEYSNEHTKDEDDAWYNLPSDSDSEDEVIPAALSLLIRPALSTAPSTDFVISIAVKKEHITSARIKAIYILERKSLSQIRVTTDVAKTAVYRLIAVAKERG